MFIPDGYEPIADVAARGDKQKIGGFLAAGKLTAYVLDPWGRLKPIGAEFWRLRDGPGVLEEGILPKKTSGGSQYQHGGCKVLIKIPKQREAAPKSSISPNDIYLSPFMKIMLEAIKEFGIDATSWPKKEELTEHFRKKKLPDGSTVSPNQAEHMATFCRPFEAMKGGQKRVG